MNDFHGRIGSARVLREESPRGLDRGFNGAQHGDRSADFRCCGGQCGIRSHDGHGRAFHLRDGGPERSASHNDGVGIGRQLLKTKACLCQQVGGEFPRVLNGLTEIRSHFMAKFFASQTNTIGRVFEYLAISADRVQKRNAHGLLPSVKLSEPDSSASRRIRRVVRRQPGRLLYRHCCDVTLG
ncbi:hypothetical protein [Paraburkholderia strydomiana]|uniref:hypothetical protein n=1 Tax=Paraburkholderia strydomiana TaxID=1245417 RepID=UPI0038BDF1F0